MQGENTSRSEPPQFPLAESLPREAPVLGARIPDAGSGDVTLAESRPGRTRLSRTKSPTLKDVAALAGVHFNSASVVLNGAKSGTGVSAATRQRILNAAKDVGYKRNGSMVAGRTGRFGSVALLMSSDPYRSNLPPMMWNGIHDELATDNRHLIMSRLPAATLDSPRELPKILKELVCDGLLVDVTHAISEYLVEAVEAHTAPAVWLNVLREFDSVRPDDYGAGRRAGELLLVAGCRSVLYAGYERVGAYENQHYSLGARWTGVRDAFEDAGGIALEAPFPERSNEYVDDVESLKRLLHPDLGLDGVVVYSCTFAKAVFDAARQLGRNVPADLKIVSFDEVPQREWGMELTSFLVPDAEVGCGAVQMLMRKLDGEAEPEPSIAVPFGLYPGQTCPV